MKLLRILIVIPFLLLLAIPVILAVPYVWMLKWLGDEINGFKSDAKMLASLEDVARELIVAAVAYYPDSEFAKKYGMA